ncbi:unnamed protein product [Peronospora destructor]|uniref:Uncharacterized protein n=1 Tax=Peronospora destructor TaxID=86335 RepID=A0AAV0TJE2_9STRA|nr:unnamed protein product [Peronospora destructor]
MALAFGLKHATAGPTSCWHRSCRQESFLQDVKPKSLLSNYRVLMAADFSSSQWKPLGLKEGVKTTSSMTPTMQILAAYVVVGVSAMVLVARYKSRDAQEDENVRTFNMAKRAVVKDRRIFETVGYPKEFERIKTT